MARTVRCPKCGRLIDAIGGSGLCGECGIVFVPEANDEAGGE